MYPKTFLLAAIVTTCWANSNIFQNDTGHIALHRLRRSLITVPGAAVVDYASSSLPCFGEGFYNHPSDCTKFYRCLDVFKNKHYVRATFNCPSGTLFSSEYNTCIPGNCARGLTPASAAVSNNYENLQCSSEGRFAHPDDCGQFYECVPNHSGGLVAHQHSCNGYAFHPTLKACVKPQMVEGCTPVSFRSSPVAVPELKHLCNDESHPYKCLDCKTMLHCIDGSPYKIPCEGDNVCSIQKKFGGAVCFPSDQAKQCKCEENNVNIKDDYDPSKYLSCGNEGTEPTIKTCPENELFNELRTKCTEICTKPGTFPFKDTCTSYFYCISTIKGWDRKTLICEEPNMFNEVTGQCENPCKWHSNSHTCQSEGRFPHPADCTKYYQCIADTSVSNKFRSVEYMCPEKYEWSQIENNHGSCVATTEPKCTSCKIPDDWCDVCPEAEGFIRSGDTKQCFKLFTDQKLTWDQAKTKCEGENMRLAEPADNIAISLRRGLVAKHGDASAWIGSRGDGISFKWQSGDGGIPNDSSLWIMNPNSIGLTGDKYCLSLEVLESKMSDNPKKPYSPNFCTKKAFPLCQRG